MLFFSGGGNPLPQSEEEREELAANLRDYIDRGGFIFADGDGCSSDFDQALPRTHGPGLPESPSIASSRWTPRIRSGSPTRRSRRSRSACCLGIDYGCRTSVVYAPCNPPGDPKPSLACLWELSRGGRQDSYSLAVKEKIQGGLAIGINVLAYATNREFKEKDLIPEKVVPRGAHDKVDRGKFAVAKLQHPGGCDAAPRALANLMEQAGHELNIRVETHPKLIGMQDPALFDYAVVFMHGRNAFRLTDGERKALRDLCASGAGCCLPTRSAATRPLANRSAARWPSSFPRTPWKTSRPATRSGRTSTAVPISRPSCAATRSRAGRASP